ncbi:MAG: NADH-quinone oxidoreductase subunit NuoN [Actinobacteria bacterium]|jgi:NADH-quinone oxidoreductase subunit N|nr:NADH-quinone oxidoreductase subunit NuoN [Actinomycetota bacterium]MSZ81000.1 NADH-quinone oxidoreductase subunit NuoN [Actinomycetota bacterium]MTB12918.1 NADH-quinone oxidoreductase subunit NuoN [Actinomycetota bacterium]
MILGAGIVLLLLLDLFLSDARKWMLTPVASFTLLGAFIPVLTLALNNAGTRQMFDGRYVIDDFSLVMKGMFLLAGYVVVLLAADYIREGDYYQGEFWFLMLSSIMGMVMMASSRDLISIFVSLEFLSIPAYMLAAWRKRDSRSNEAGIKYYLLGVFASAIMLYGMSLLYGITNSTKLTEIGASLGSNLTSIRALAVFFVVIGFAFKISAVPFHTWAPDTYQGAPTPVTAFLSVASKAAGFVALVTVVYVGFPGSHAVWQPVFWILSAATMTLGNVMALKQTSIVRMLAYSSIAQGGFILMPLAVAGEAGVAQSALRAVVTYLIVYAATNLGVFAVVMVVARKTRSGEISSYGGLFSYAPGIATLMTIFMASLAGIPPLGGWFGKFAAFQSLVSAGTTWAYVLAVIGGVNSVVAFGYYGGILREMWMRPVPDGDTSPVIVKSSLAVALGITSIATLLLGVLPGIVIHFGDLAGLAGAFGR